MCIQNNELLSWIIVNMCRYFNNSYQVIFNGISSVYMKKHEVRGRHKHNVNTAQENL